MKHFGDCVLWYKCKKPRHTSTNYSVKGKVIFTCREEGNMKEEYLNTEKPTPKILPSKPKVRSYQMTLNIAKE